MYLELNNLFVFENQNPVNTNIENEIEKLNNTGISECYTSFLNDIYIKILIRRITENRYSIICFKYNNTTEQYDDLMLNGNLAIDHNKLLISRLTTLDRNTDILYSKGRNDGEFIKSVYCKNNLPMLSEYVIEHPNVTCQDEFEKLCNQQYCDEINCISLIVVNNVGKPLIVKNKNGLEFINTILRQQVQKSDGFDYGLLNQLNYSRAILECQHINNIRLFQELGKEYFNQLTSLNDFLQGFGLQLLQQHDPFKQNFAIIPVCTDGHISTLLFDLRPNIPEQISERLYSFDSSLYHYEQNIFGNLLAEDHKLSTQSLQLTGCCGYWTSCFIEECSEIEDIEEVKQQFKTGEMQLKVACRVSGIIDMNRHQHNIGFIKKIHLPSQIADEMSNDEYEAGNFIVKMIDSNIDVLSKNSDINVPNEEYETIETIKKCKIGNFIEIKVKDTNKYFLLDRENIYKSTCVDLKAIYNLVQQKDSQLIISDDDLTKLKEQAIKQNQKLFNMKQEIIEEIQEQIEPIKNNLEIELNEEEQNELFCNNLAKFEYLKNRIELNLGRQWKYLTIQNYFCEKSCFLRDYLELPYECIEPVKHFKKTVIAKQNQTLADQTEDLRNNSRYYSKLNENCTQLLELVPQNKQQYLMEQREHYNQLFIIEQQSIKNAQNDYSQIPNAHIQQQLNAMNGCFSEMKKSLDENLSNSTSKTAQLAE